MGLEVWMITGDNQRIARAIAEQVAFSWYNPWARSLPEQKNFASSELLRWEKVVKLFE